MSMNSQKKAIKEFRSVSGATEKIAKEYLSKSKYNLSAALNSFFNSGPSKSSSNGDATKLTAMFNKYAGEDDEKDTMVDMEQFCEDVGASEVMALVLCFKLDAANVGELSRKEFVDGFGSLSCDTISKIKAWVSRTAKMLLSRNSEFKAFHRWLFSFLKDSEERKTLDKDAGLEIMRMTLTDAIFPLNKRYCSFLESDKGPRHITRDLWDMTYDFACVVKPDLSNWDDCDDAWPVAIDEFVEMMQNDK